MKRKAKLGDIWINAGNTTSPVMVRVDMTTPEKKPELGSYAWMLRDGLATVGMHVGPTGEPKEAWTFVGLADTSPELVTLRRLELVMRERKALGRLEPGSTVERLLAELDAIRA